MTPTTEPTGSVARVEDDLEPDPEGEDAEPYTPTETEKVLVAEVERKFTKWKTDREQHEVQWFINAAFYRGQQFVAWDNQFHTLRNTDPMPVPPHKKKIPINRIFPKIRARLAKFLRARPQPVVIPASTERKDKLNARGSQIALDYAWRKFRLEVKYRNALLWAKDCGKGFWWLNWDKTAKGRIKITNPLTQAEQILSLPLGDVSVEVGSPFEVLVADPTIGSVDEQPEILRIRMREVAEQQKRFPKFKHLIKASAGHEQAFHFEKRIAALTARAEGMTLSEGEESGSAEDGSNKNQVLVKELFTRPGGQFEQGRYLVVVGDVLVRNEQELPFFADMDSPYPVVEFVDVPSVGQFWNTTIIEQLIGPQRQYNFIRNKIDQQLRLMMHPKIFTPTQAQIPKNAFHSGPGEVIRWNWIPGLPAPFAWTPPNVASDAWRMIQTLKEEIEDISQIFPGSEGAVGDAKSGYQTNLLQEASESVHAPDARAHELAIEQAAWKIRRLMKLGYDIPRLLTVTGRHRQAEVVEFHSDQIDENADIVVQTGSGLPTLKAARQQILLDYFDKGIFGDPKDPETRRKFLSMSDVGGLETMQDPARKDEELAEQENDEIAAGHDIAVPQFYENHNLHYTIHSDQLKSPEAKDWDDEVRFALIAHLLLHFKYINPMAAANFALEYGLNNLIGIGIDKIPPPMPPGGMPPGPGQEPPPEGVSDEPPAPPMEESPEQLSQTPAGA